MDRTPGIGLEPRVASLERELTILEDVVTDLALILRQVVEDVTEFSCWTHEEYAR